MPCTSTGRRCCSAASCTGSGRTTRGTPWTWPARLNRVAELELLTADKENAGRKVGEVERLTGECSKVLAEVFASLERGSAHGDLEVLKRANSRRGECGSLQARAGLWRMDLAEGKGGAEDARSKARGASDVYNTLTELCAKGQPAKPEAKAGPKKGKWKPT